MNFTGERFIPTEQGRIRLEHMHRYAVVLDLISGKDVLDLASGEGYGSFLLADAARTVTGVDISNEAVQHAKAEYGEKSNLSFYQGSAAKLDLADASFDVVVSFETIEHILEQGQMLVEIRRVLRPDGLLVISSPNRPVYSEESGEHNAFHAKELDFNEFDALLKLQFPAVQYYGQRMMMGSVIQPLAGGQKVFQAWQDNGTDLVAGSGQVAGSVYFLAICGMIERKLPYIDASVVYPDKLDLIKQYVGFAKWAQQLGQMLEEREDQITRLNQDMAEREEQIAHLTDETVKRGEWALRLDAELKEERSKLLAIISSHSWRLTLPLREARRWVFFPKEQVKRLEKGSLRLAKRMYKSLPWSEQAKAVHRDWLAKYFPKILLSSYYPMLSAPASPHTPMHIPLKEVSHFSDSVNTINIPSSQHPLVTVIIPIYGKIDYTLCCLASISANPPQADFEVIVVDDCSPDHSAKVLSDIKGIRLIQNPQNQGFIRSCNRGSKSARGEYLYFLNNDTQVTSGWLDELLRTFREFPGTGLVGSKLLYPEGQLQEAGGIIWQDGSAWNFGRHQDPQRPIFNYAREVDYCSGASIMVPKALFGTLGLFDEHYLPAYCEDSDLALKIRDKGYRVIYQPMSAVFHCEGITSGTDITQGTKAYQAENVKKLYARWKSLLQTHQRPGTDVDNAKDRRATRRVLVLDHCTPTPNQDAGSVTVFNLLLLLREMDFQVTFIPEGNFLYMPEYTPSLQRVGVEVLYAPYVTNVEGHLKDCGARYDLVFLFRPVVVDRHIKTIRKYCKKAKVLFHTVDLHFLRMSREAKLQSDHSKQKTADKMKQCELAAIRAADAAIVHSTAEFELLAHELPKDKLHVFPLIMDVPGTEKNFSERRDMVFVGGYQHTPNVDAVQYFLAKIMPLLRHRLPGVRVYVAGSKPPPEIQCLASEDVIITGFVEDLTSLLDKMRVSVVPLRYGAGIKGKIGTAMSVGLPVVGTTLAAEGMSLTDGENILIADGAQAFTEAVVKLYSDAELWRQLSKSGLEFASSAWGAESSWKVLNVILRDIGIKTTRGGHSLSLYSGFGK